MLPTNDSAGGVARSRAPLAAAMFAETARKSHMPPRTRNRALLHYFTRAPWVRHCNLSYRFVYVRPTTIRGLWRIHASRIPERNLRNAPAQVGKTKNLG